jgi:hypothetical protein
MHECFVLVSGKWASFEIVRARSLAPLVKARGLRDDALLVRP